VLRRRNQHITLAYSQLSERLATLISGRDGHRDANWCTFATWSSRTIGTWIREDPHHPVGLLPSVPAYARRWLDWSTRYLTNRCDGASYRVLAAGNRIVFREIGLLIALFLEAFGDVDRERPREDQWDAYLADVHHVLHDMARLDESWLPTVMPDPWELCFGLRQYYEALFTSERKARAELVLAGSILLAAYEQRRVDGYTGVVLALFVELAVRRLVDHGSGTLRGWGRRLPSSLYARIATRCIAVSTPDEWLWIGRPLPPPSGSTDQAPIPDDLDTISSPLLAALLERYDRSGGHLRHRRIRDWTSFDQRMNYIVNVFRSRQQRATLFAPPFPL